MMSNKKEILVKGRTISAQNPSVCVPLVGITHDELIETVLELVKKEPDIIEWRADYYERLENIQLVLKTLASIRNAIGEIPLLFTIRAEKEGGQAISLTVQEKIEIMNVVCASGQIDLIDLELFHNKEEITQVRDIAKKHQVLLILSYHNFQATPALPTLLEKCVEAELLGADLAKISVMAQDEKDVLHLLQVTQEANESTAIPLITISMGPLGSITRMFGFAFGSCITFGIGYASSAPGQIPIEDVRQVIKIVQRSLNHSL